LGLHLIFVEAVAAVGVVLIAPFIARQTNMCSLFSSILLTLHLTLGHHSVGHTSETIDNNSFKRVEQFKYLETTLMNQNSIQEEIKSNLKTGNPCRIFCLPVCYTKI
jgi:hypothetical protein